MMTMVTMVTMMMMMMMVVRVSSINCKVFPKHLPSAAPIVGLMMMMKMIIMRTMLMKVVRVSSCKVFSASTICCTNWSFDDYDNNDNNDDDKDDDAVLIIMITMMMMMMIMMMVDRVSSRSCRVFPASTICCTNWSFPCTLPPPVVRRTLNNAFRHDQSPFNTHQQYKQKTLRICSSLRN